MVNLFRVFDKIERRFILNDVTLEEVFTDFQETILIDPNPFKNRVVQQCTGLVDKNGTNIYDGDIVSYDYYYDGTGHKEVNQMVVVKLCLTCNLTPDHNSSFDGYEEFSNIQIIGHKYMFKPQDRVIVNLPGSEFHNQEFFVMLIHHPDEGGYLLSKDEYDNPVVSVSEHMLLPSLSKSRES